MFVKTTTHKRIVAEKDAEIANQKKLIKKLTAERDLKQQAYNTMCMHLVAEKNESTRLRSENTGLYFRLAPFTKIRNRDSRGRFIKDVVA